jgi:hypothetical protein
MTDAESPPSISFSRWGASGDPCVPSTLLHNRCRHFVSGSSLGIRYHGGSGRLLQRLATWGRPSDCGDCLSAACLGKLEAWTKPERVDAPLASQCRHESRRTMAGPRQRATTSRHNADSARADRRAFRSSDWLVGSPMGFRAGCRSRRELGAPGRSEIADVAPGWRPHKLAHCVARGGPPNYSIVGGRPGNDRGRPAIHFE